MKIFPKYFAPILLSKLVIIRNTNSLLLLEEIVYSSIFLEFISIIPERYNLPSGVDISVTSVENF